MKLFPKNQVKGVFKGFSEGGLEFHADIVLKYQNEFQSIPMHGQFILVALENDDEAVLGRITSISAQGRLSSSAGEDYGIRAVEEDRTIPEDLREQYLKYKINIRVLGVLRVNGKSLIFSPSHRRLPHVGSKVAFPSDEIIKEVAGHNIPDAAEIGFFALGEFIYSGSDSRLLREDWMQIKSPCVIPKFHVKQLVSRRSFVFARAGFGKSNLVKLLFSSLYRQTPTITKRGNREVPVGSIIFDPDGEYFWPDDKNRPGLCDVPGLEDKVVVFTRKEGPSPFYGSFIAGNIKLDIRRLRPADVISIAIPAENQDQQNIRKLKALAADNWNRLVDEIHRNRYAADEDLIRNLLGLGANEESQLSAARANMIFIVGLLHDPSSQMMDMLFSALRQGKICVIDVSQMRGKAGLILSGIILQQIFEHNQSEFTKAQPESIPTIAVLEEAQSVLGSTGGSESPYVSWVKEGRKYDLGAILITQQPGSISHEILSQGDNWFIFHLLSSGDLRAVKNANAHFSDDLLSALLNEPIPGNGVFWSSAGETGKGKIYPIPIRVLSFENSYVLRDPNYDKGMGNTFANQIRNLFQSVLEENRINQPSEINEIDHDEAMPAEEVGDVQTVEVEDVQETYRVSAINKIKENADLINRIKSSGIHWYGFQKEIEKCLPEFLVDKEQFSYNLVKRTLNEALGEGKWKTEMRPKKTGTGNTTWIFAV